MKRKAIATVNKSFMRSVLATILAFTVMFTTVMVVPVTAEAKTTATSAAKAYKDVSKKTANYKAINFVYKRGGWKGIAADSKLKPTAKMKQVQAIQMITSIHGKNCVKVTMDDYLNANKVVTAEWLTSKYVEAAGNLGVGMTWKGGKNKLTRAEVAEYEKIFENFDPALDPLKPASSQ